MTSLPLPSPLCTSLLSVAPSSLFTRLPECTCEQKCDQGELKTAAAALLSHYLIGIANNQSVEEIKETIRTENNMGVEEILCCSSCRYDES